MTTEGNFFVRQDVTEFFMMLQGARARGGAGIQALGAGWAGIRAPGAGWGGDSGPGAGWGGFRAGARGGSFLGVRWEIFYLFAVFSPFG